jgi:predicted alpha-1,6-mannanase (GH76 family)
METSEETPDARAQAAAESVKRAFGHEFLGLRGTWLAWVWAPHPRPQLPWSEWHYWWQAHLLDCLVDASLREVRTGAAPSGDTAAKRSLPPSLALAQRHLKGIRLRNFGRFPNLFFDDMAWLALASARTNELARKLTGNDLPPASDAVQILAEKLRGGHTDDLGGGMFWNTRRKYKNTATTAPAALFFARTGDTDRAQALVDWLYRNLVDPDSGLFLDGLHLENDGGTRLDPAVYAYNQGPILGALLELGGGNLGPANDLVRAIDAGLTDSRGLLKAHGGGDGGLFMGILGRYLAVAADDRRLPEGTRATARRLVTDTAEALWHGRDNRGSQTVFPAHPGELASSSYPLGSPVELCTQLQAWMLLEAAATLAAGGN